MTKATRKLFLVELRRQWTTASFFIPISLAALSFFMLVAMAKLQKVYDFAGAAANVNLGMIVPLSVCLFAVGAVGVDVKEGWLRTLLIRPVTRQHYLLVKFAALFVSFFITVIVAGVLPNIATGLFFVKGTLRFDLGAVLWVHAIFLLQGFLILAMMVFFSCWVPGIFNVVLVGMWFIASAIVEPLLQRLYWSDQVVMTLREFLFPNGFTLAADAIVRKLDFPGTEILWGLAALALFLALSFWSIARIQVDRSSE